MTGSGGRVHDRATLDILEGLEAESFEQVVWRIARKGRDPLRGAIAAGRWNAVGEMEVLYTSVERDGALAEVGYRLSLEPVWPSRIEHEIHRISVTVENALRFKNLAELKRLGVDVAKYESFEYTATQAIAAAAHFMEFDAVVVLSARHAASNIVLFLDGLATPPELLGSEEVDWNAWRARARK